MKPLPATENDAINEAKIRSAQLHAQFESVFGQPGKRTAAQRNVLEHLEKCAGGDDEDANAYSFRGAGDGLKCIAAGIHVDGARSVLRIISRQLKLAANAKKPKADKPKTKR